MGVGFGMMELVVLLLLGGAASPFGVPPEKEDPVLLQMAPDDCLFYGMMSGTVAPSGDSTNHTEQMLAEPEVRAFVQQLEQQLNNLVAQLPTNPNSPEAVAKQFGPPLVKMILERPLALFISDVTVDPTNPDGHAGLVVSLDEEAKGLIQRLNSQLVLNLLPPGTQSVQQHAPASPPLP